METLQINRGKIIFLKKFTGKIIGNLAEKYEYEKRIEIEKLKKEIFKPLEKNEEDENFKKIVNHRILHGLKYPKESIKKTEKIKIPEKKLKKLVRGLPLPKVNTLPIKIHPKVIDIGLNNDLPPKEFNKLQVLESIKPEYKPLPPGFNLGKLENLLSDPLIQSIECPGPGKNILVRKFNKINLTKLVINQEEINEIINKFSQQAKIPLLGGILKAAVGDLIISAVTSEFVGSRFIISRISHNL